MLCLSRRASQVTRKVIRMTFLPALTGQSAFNDEIRRLLALPLRQGGLGITNPVIVVKRHHYVSVRTCQPLVKAILDQKGDPFVVRGLQR